MKVSFYELLSGKNPYQWVLEVAGATVHAFEEFGSYQGDWLAKVTYKGKTGWIKDYYGSCSGCDAFENETCYEDKTKKEWESFCHRFAKDYLDNIRSYEDVLKDCEENIEWDYDAKEMVKWLKETEQNL